MTRRAFTLIELLIVIAIMAVLATLALITFNSLTASDRVSGAARQVQSGLAGARDRAIYAGSGVSKGESYEPQHGLRFVVDPSMPGAVTSLQFIERPKPHITGTISLERPDTDGDNSADADEIRYVRGVNTGWHRLKLMNVLTTGCRIRIPKTGRWYVIEDVSLTPAAELLRLSVDYQDRQGIAAMPSVWAIDLTDYILELNPFPSPNSQPMELPSGTLIDLAQSYAIPPYAGSSFDVMFSPKGGCVGTAATAGLIHFYIGDVRDVTEGRNPAIAKHGNRVVTLRTATGSAEIYPVDPTDANADGIADAPFRFGER